MSELTISILSNAVWEMLKKGVEITSSFLKEKLIKWIMTDEQMEKIKNIVNEVPSQYTMSEGLLREYLSLNDELAKVLSNIKSSEITVNQHIQNNQGVSVGVMTGGSVYNYNAVNSPRKTEEKVLKMNGIFKKYMPVQVVKSYANIRENLPIVGNETQYVQVHIDMPESVRHKDGCQFAMLLFPFVPSENFSEYYDEDYSLSFTLETSENIKQVQMQIKNRSQQQFIDFPIRNGQFCEKIKNMADRTSWSDVLEICFTIFADDSYMTGESGYIKITDFQLSK